MSLTADSHCLVLFALYRRQPDRSEELAEFVDAWHIPKTCQLALEEWCWSGIQAPPGIAPPSKRPFTVPSSINCSQWISITKVTGKYLLSQVFEGEHLGVLCEILDYMAACLASEFTPADIARIKRLARKVAGHVDKYFPPTMQSLVMHMLIFHMPGELEMWGPARGFWCFPYERSVEGSLA